MKTLFVFEWMCSFQLFSTQKLHEYIEMSVAYIGLLVQRKNRSIFASPYQVNSEFWVVENKYDKHSQQSILIFKKAAH